MEQILVPSAILPPVQPPPGLISYSQQFVGRQELRALVTPDGTSTHRPIPHFVSTMVLARLLTIHTICTSISTLLHSTA